MHRLLLLVLATLFFSTAFGFDCFSASKLCSTASDPDAIIEKCANAINGDFCETVTDLIIAGPDPLVLQRFHNARNYVTGNGYGGWRIFPQTLLVVGKDPKGKACKIRGEQFEWTYAFTGEHSGSLFTYSGWKRMEGTTKDPLKINPQNAIGLVNTYAEAINGQTNPLNNQLHCQEGFCTLTLGDGTTRSFEKTQCPKSYCFNQNVAETLATQISSPSFYRLTHETLPSGNQVLYSYDSQGELSHVEIQNPAQKTHSWIHFHHSDNTLTLKTSDERTLTYTFENTHLKSVKGSHLTPCSYDYADGNLIRKHLPEGRFLEITYDNQGRVSSLKKPHPDTGKPFTALQFHYKEGYTDVTNALHITTRYSYDDQQQLTTLTYFDQEGQSKRTDRKYYDLIRLIARTVEDGAGNILSYRAFNYDDAGNVLEEKLYGNLTGKQDPHLLIDENGTLLNHEEVECHTKTFTHSHDGFNLLTSLNDCKGNQTTYHYQRGLLTKKLTRDTNRIRNRAFHFYNEDGICIQTIEDDGGSKDPDNLWGVKERHLTYVQPKLEVPGVGLPEITETKALDLKTQQEILVEKQINTYSLQGQLLSCTTYGSDDTTHYTVSKTYNPIGQTLTETDPEGKTISYTYNSCGEQTEILIPYENKQIQKTYDKLGRLITITTQADHLTAQEQFTYDLIGRKTSEQDRFGNQTEYIYDSLGHLTQVIYPEVLDEYNHPIHPTFTYTHDSFGNVTSITDPKGETTRKSYTLRGFPSKIDYPDGSSEFFKYDPEGSLHRSLTRDRLITIYEYDYLGRPIYEEVMTTSKQEADAFLKSRSRSYNAFHCTSIRDDQHLIDYTYDLAGKLIEVTQHKSGEKETHPDSRKTEIGYDPFGRKFYEKVWFGLSPNEYTLIHFAYDLMGNFIGKRVEDAQGAIQIQSTFAYDSTGRCIEESDSQTCVKTAYDPFGEPIAYTDSSGEVTQVSIDYSNPFKKAIINPLGLKTEMEFDALQRLISVTKQDAQGTLLLAQQIRYDPLGHKSVEKNNVIIDGNLQEIQTTRWVHGPLGRLEQLIEAEGTELEKTTHYRYNSLGQLISQIFPDNPNPLNYTYNKEGRLHRLKHTDPNKELRISNKYDYDRQGNVIAAHALGGITVQREYNLYGQVVKETIHDREERYSLGCRYDRKGRLKEITLPDHSSIRYTYGALFGEEVIRLSADGSEVYKHVYNACDTSGRLHEETLISYSGKRLTEYNKGYPSYVTTDYISEERCYDALGHTLSVLKEATFETTDAFYAYNALSQLTSDNQDHYQYDSVDNRLKHNNETLIYNSLNQLIRAGQVECSYDPLGNLKRKILDGEETLFTHNIFSQLISIKKPDKTALYFSYDPFGRRLTKKHCNLSGKYKRTLSFSRSFYLGNHHLGELDKEHHITKLRIPGLNRETLSPRSVAIELSDHVYAPLHDHAGHLIALIDPDSCEIVESYTYTAFGQETIYADEVEVAHSILGNPWRFAEKPIDEESGLIYFGVRYYDPSIGRWISKDPSDQDGPNFYAYLHNNPVNYIDYFGLKTDKFEEYFYGDVEKHCYCEIHRDCKRGGDLDKTVGGLPKIIYCDDFERSTPYVTGGIPYLPIDYGPSRLGETGGRIAVNIGIGFINGIWNNFDSARENALYLSRLAGGYRVNFVYNATHGLRDTKEYFMGLRHIATEPVRQLHAMWSNFFEKSSASEKFLMICHSQGAVHVMNALLDYPPELRERIVVVAIAPGSYIYQETCAQVTHYRNASKRRDYVPYIDKKGATRSRETIVDVISHPDAGWFDHNFQSLTYQDALIEEIDMGFKRK